MAVYAVTYSIFYESGEVIEGLRGIYSTREKAAESAREGCQTYADLYGGTVEVDIPEYPFEICVKPDIRRITEVVFGVDEVTVE